MRTLLAALVLCLSATAQAQSFKIKTETDALSKQSYLKGESLKLCQVKDAGLLAKCAQLTLAWQKEQPDLVAVRIEIPDAVSVQEIAVNFDGSVHRYGASVPVTDFNYDRGLQLALGAGFSSANSFVLPVRALESICASPESGILRVSGVHSSIDYDFWRKAKMKGAPADELRRFLDAIAGQK